MQVQRRRVGFLVVSAVAFLALTSPARAAAVRRTVDQPDAIPGPQVHVIYAVASDAVDRKLDTNGAIDTSTRSINQWLGGQVNRHVRFDRDVTDVDISFVRFARDTQTILGATDTEAIDAVSKELEAAGFVSLTKIYMVYFDGPGRQCGLAQQQRRLAIVFLESCGAVPQTWDFVPLHEMLHAFGAVPSGAPHLTTGSHVSDDPNDLMAPSVSATPRIDVDRQDYFGHGIASRFDLATSDYVEAATPFDPSSCQAVMVDTRFTATAVGGAAGTFVLSPRPCLWSLAGAPSWLTLSQAAGIGPARITLTAARNDTPSPRQAILTLGANTLLVTQAPGPDLLVAVDTPRAGATVRGPFAVSGWMFDRSSQDTSAGVQSVDIWAYPDGGGAASYLGSPQMSIGRGDVANYFQDPRAAASGFALSNATLPPGGYTLALFPFDKISGKFEAASTVHITVAPIVSDPLMWVDTPGAAEVTGTTLTIAGWAIDRAASVGAGVDAVHVWAYPTVGSPVFVGATTVGIIRADVAAYAGRPSAAPCGFAVTGPLAPGTYQLVVFARSVLTGTFNNVRVVPITVR